MGKLVLPLERIDQEDLDLFGERIVALARAKKIGLPVPDGAALSFSAFEKYFAPSSTTLKDFFSTPNPVRNNQLVDIFNLLKRSLHLAEEIETSLKTYQKNFGKLITLKTFIYLGGQQVEFSKTTSLPKTWSGLIADSYLQFLNPEILARVEKFEDLKISLLIINKGNAQVAVLALSSHPDKLTCSLRAQWGEYNSFIGADEIKVKKTDISEFVYQAAKQERQFLYKNGELTTIPVATKFQTTKKLALADIKIVVGFLKTLENLFLTPIELDFEIDNARPVITRIAPLQLPAKKLNLKEHISINLPLVSRLKPLVPGIAIGMTKQLGKRLDLNKLRKGDIAIVGEISKKNLKQLSKASGVIVAKVNNLGLIRNLNIPAVVGLANSLAGQVITINGKDGAVYKGGFASPFPKIIEANKPVVRTVFKTATKIFLNLDHPSQLTEIEESSFDGIAPFKTESLIADLKFHPEKLLGKDTANKVSSLLVEKIAKTCELANEKPVIYRLTDFHSHQLINLIGGRDHETREVNPLLGLRGAKRHLTRPGLLNLELRVIREVRNKNNFKNLWLALPFVRTREEFTQLKGLVTSSGLNRSPSFKLLLEIDLAANIFSLEEFIAQGLDGVLIDHLSLLNFTLASNYSLNELAKIASGEIRGPLTEILNLTSKHKLFSCIYNFPYETEKKLLGELLALGIKAVSTQPSELQSTKKLIHQLESALVNN